MASDSRIAKLKADIARGSPRARQIFAINVLLDKRGTYRQIGMSMQKRVSYLQELGLQDQEIAEAANIAGGMELCRTGRLLA